MKSTHKCFAVGVGVGVLACYLYRRANMNKAGQGA